jgi:hypothetical protein
MLLRCFGAAVLLLSVVAAASALTFAEPIAMLGWPGLLIVNAVCARFEIYEGTPGNFGPMFAAGLVIDVVIYTLLFFFMLKGWKMFATTSVTKR